MVNGKKLCRAAFLSLLLEAGKLMPLEGSGREVSQWGNVLGLPLSSLRTGGNLVFCSVPEICHWGQVVDYLWCESAIWYLAP